MTSSATPPLVASKASRPKAAIGDEIKAVLVYDTRTPPVASAPGAECLTVRDGKIVYNRFIFDRLPFEAARRAAD